MGILGIREKQHRGGSTILAARLNSRIRVWMPWLLMVFIPLPLLCVSPDLASACVPFPYETTHPRGQNSLPAKSRSSVETEITKFHADFDRISRLSAMGKYSRYRTQLQIFLAQAKQIEAHAQTDYEANLSGNSQDLQDSATALAMVVDAVATVSHELDGPHTPASNAKLADQTRAWLKRLGLGLEQYKDVLNFYSKGPAHASPDRDSLNNPYALYSEARTALARAKGQLSAGDALGAWLSMVQCDMLVGNLAMRLPPSTSE